MFPRPFLPRDHDCRARFLMNPIPQNALHVQLRLRLNPHHRKLKVPSIRPHPRCPCRGERRLRCIRAAPHDGRPLFLAELPVGRPVDKPLCEAGGLVGPDCGCVDGAVAPAGADGAAADGLPAAALLALCSNGWGE